MTFTFFSCIIHVSSSRHTDLMHRLSHMFHVSHHLSAKCVSLHFVTFFLNSYSSFSTLAKRKEVCDILSFFKFPAYLLHFLMCKLNTECVSIHLFLSAFSDTLPIYLQFRNKLHRHLQQTFQKINRKQRAHKIKCYPMFCC